jgi:hypothetical protein
MYSKVQMAPERWLDFDGGLIKTVEVTSVTRIEESDRPQLTPLRCGSGARLGFGWVMRTMMASASFVSGRARCASTGCARRTGKVSGFGRRTLGGYPTMWRCTSVHSSNGGCQVPVSHPPTHQGRRCTLRECRGHPGTRKANSSELEHRGDHATVLVMAGRSPRSQRPSGGCRARRHDVFGRNGCAMGRVPGSRYRLQTLRSL